uniref:Uncharacterized protein n=1 Tax=Romanomermis culicivorax TaxID=13658 RepID=A0A915IW23_ROMCU
LDGRYLPHEEQTDDPKKLPVLSTEELANEIFPSQFCSTGSISNTNPMVTNISSVRMSPALPNMANVNVIIWAMSKQQTNQAAPATPQLPPTKFQPPTGEAIPIAMQAEVLERSLTTEELLNRPTSAQDVEPANEELLDMPIFDLNMAKLLLSIDVSAPPALTATAHFRATTGIITDFLKLTLDDIMTLAPVLMEKSC